MSNNPLYGLVCAGGGAHGAYQVGALKYIHEHFCIGERSPFQLFSGTSCGNLNTSFFAARSWDARKSRLWLEELWLGFDVPSYHGSMLKNAIFSLFNDLKKPPREKKPCWSLLDPGPLRDITKKGIKREDLEKAFDEESTLAIAISATEFRTGRACWFLEGKHATSWNIYHSIGIEDRISPLHVQASCSVPIALPPVKIGDFYYVDGGVADRRPLAPVTNMGATRVLNIATDRPHTHDLPPYPPGWKPRLPELINMLVNQLSHDYATDQAFIFDLVNFFNKQQASDDGSSFQDKFQHYYSGKHISPNVYRPVEILSLAPSKRIRFSDIYDYDDEELLHAETPSKETLFKFKKEFIRELIDFGYEDTRAAHEKLKFFFDRERQQMPEKFSQFGGSEK